MLFTSVRYALFLPVVLTLYYLVPRQTRAVLLLFASYLFYASWNPRYLRLLVGMTAMNFLLGLWLARTRDDRGAGRRLLFGAVAANVLVLAYFKYTAFLVAGTVSAIQILGFQLEGPTVRILLPLGISFFTFEFIHYIVDIGRGHPPIRSPLKFALFVAFFPTQLAGPIKRYQQFVPQIDSPLPLDWGRVGEGGRLLMTGLLKKLVLADNLAPLVALGFDRLGRGELALAQLDALLVIMAFGLQIYLDFSGYTDMGCGVALLLGYRVPENFRRPLLARNIGDFWRRWHISLSDWLRDYVFRPLGWGRGKRFRSVMITMLIAGVWHGAGWTFLLWGLCQGFLFIAYWLARPLLRWVAHHCPQPLKPVYAFSGWLVTIFLIFCTLALFRSQSLSQAISLLGALSGLVPGRVRLYSVGQEAIIMGLFVAILGFEAFLEWLEQPAGAKLRESAVWRGFAELRPVLYALLLMVIVILSPESERAFVYFQF